MAAVPLIIDRIYKGILAKVENSGPFAAKLFHFCVQYRLRWNKLGMETPLVKLLIFRKIKQLVGGNMKYMAVGSAPLASVAQEFVRTVLDIKICQGYGLTETISTATGQDIYDMKTGNVGPPLAGVDIKLLNWEEGGYKINDTCGPRGEIVVGGPHIAKGYYKMPEKTQEDFQDDLDGFRWFKTGDIGQFLENGTLMIIDRKKDLVKPQGGEYISLGKGTGCAFYYVHILKFTCYALLDIFMNSLVIAIIMCLYFLVEGVLKLNQVINSICVVVCSDQTFSTAIIVPEEKSLAKFAKNVLEKSGFTVSQLCQDESVKNKLCKHLLEFGLMHGLAKFEIPKKITLVLDEWTPESGLITAASKLKRKEVEKYYSSEIKRMYESSTNENIIYYENI